MCNPLATTNILLDAHSEKDDTTIYSSKTVGKKNRAKGSAQKTTTKPRKLKKAPGAPRRFKSAFIFYSTWKHKEIKERLRKEGSNERMVSVAKMVSQAWRGLSPEERYVWEEKARLDKERFEVEKAMYNGPWKVEATAARFVKKDPRAPRKPMSAYLSFSNSKRAMVKQMNPKVSNAEVSKILAAMWREAPKEVRRVHIEKEARLRKSYKAEIKVWRTAVEEKLAKERQERENEALLLSQIHRQQQEACLKQMSNTEGVEGSSSLPAELPYEKQNLSGKHLATDCSQYFLSEVVQPKAWYLTGASDTEQDARSQNNPQSSFEWAWRALVTEKFQPKQQQDEKSDFMGSVGGVPATRASDWSKFFDDDLSDDDDIMGNCQCEDFGDDFFDQN